MELHPHPDHPPRAVTAVVVEATRAGHLLTVRFTVGGEMSGLAMADGAGRTDGLWRHTCFEAFVAGSGPAYREFNLAPSGAWATYDFDDRRAGMRAAGAAPVTKWDDRTLDATLDVAATGDWRLNLTAVIEEADGTRSFWALAHPDGPPDFHDPACFVLALPAAG